MTSEDQQPGMGKLEDGPSKKHFKNFWTTVVPILKLFTAFLPCLSILNQCSQISLNVLENHEK